MIAMEKPTNAWPMRVEAAALFRQNNVTIETMTAMEPSMKACEMPVAAAADCLRSNAMVGTMTVTAALTRAS